MIPVAVYNRVMPRQTQPRPASLVSSGRGGAGAQHGSTDVLAISAYWMLASAIGRDGGRHTGTAAGPQQEDERADRGFALQT